MDASDYSIFEYMYRDAGNFKAYGVVLLKGVLTDADVDSLCRRFDGGEFFIAEQIGVPTLCQQLWDECGCEPSDDLDHVWHEFHEIRAATLDDLVLLPRWGDSAAFIARIADVERWDESLSQNWTL